MPGVLVYVCVNIECYLSFVFPQLADVPLSVLESVVMEILDVQRYKLICVHVCECMCIYVLDTHTHAHTQN